MKTDIENNASPDQLPDLAELPELELEQVSGGFHYGASVLGIIKPIIKVVVGYFIG